MRLLLPLILAIVVPGCASAGGHDNPYRSGSHSKWGGKARERCERLEPLMRRAASRYNVDLGLIAGIIRVESTFRPTVVSRAGAVGLMQVMPSNGRNLSCGDLRDPANNVSCGLRVLRGFLRKYDNDLVYALSGYNAGYRTPNRARRNGTLPSNFRYVERVLAARSAFMRQGCAAP